MEAAGWACPRVGKVEVAATKSWFLDVWCSEDGKSYDMHYFIRTSDLHVSDLGRTGRRL